MSNVNTAVISGNLTADPEMKLVGADGDFAITNLRVATNRSKKNPDGDGYVDEVSYLDVTVLGGFGKLCDRKLRKADAVTVSGRLEQQRWQDGEGNNRSKVVIIANDIDSPAFFKKDEEVAAKENGDSTAQASAPAADAKDDDIPF